MFLTRKMFPLARNFSHRGRRRGISMWLFVGSLPVIVGMCGLVIDIGQLYARRAQAQRAADAAALAGASVSGGNAENANVISTALQYAALNGFDPNNARKPATVHVIPSYGGVAGSTYDNSVYVSVSTNEPVYFAPILEGMLRALGKSNDAVRFSRLVGASARAQKIVHLPLKLGGPYGIADPNKSPANLSVFGPEAFYNFGDAYSTQFLENGSPNPLYDQYGGVSKFSATVTDAYAKSTKDSLVHFQIYDPDSYSAGGQDSYDETRSPNPANQHDATHPDLSASGGVTTTQYTLRKDGHMVSVTYGADPATDGQWVEPPGFAIDTRVWGTGNYTIEVKSLSGSSENGFLLRAGPTEGLTMDDTTWNATYGDKMGTAPDNSAVPISANDHLQMNFTKSGSTTFQLGYVPKTFAGSSIGVQKFDVDIGSTDLVYTCDSLPGKSFAGVLPNPGNGVWSTDKIDVPADYSGGTWSATYTAGAGDTSDWSLLGQTNQSGEVRLVE